MGVFSDAGHRDTVVTEPRATQPERLLNLLSAVACCLDVGLLAWHARPTYAIYTVAWIHRALGQVSLQYIRGRLRSTPRYEGTAFRHLVQVYIVNPNIRKYGSQVDCVLQFLVLLPLHYSRLNTAQGSGGA